MTDIVREALESFANRDNTTPYIKDIINEIIKERNIFMVGSTASIGLGCCCPYASIGRNNRVVNNFQFNA